MVGQVWHFSCGRTVLLNKINFAENQAMSMFFTFVLTELCVVVLCYFDLCVYTMLEWRPFMVGQRWRFSLLSLRQLQNPWPFSSNYLVISWYFGAN